ncbi:MAG: transporter, family [Crocinitomicaceae bacterium]|nr:transporter, family [Crocinitomicaceae bacterium]
MKRIKNLIFYVAIIGGFSFLIYWITFLGEKLEIGRNIVIPETVKTHWQELTDVIVHNLQHPLALIIAQIVTIILVARLFGWLFNKIGQPSVIGEIIAGIVLGPSLFGMYFPEASKMLFPVQSLENLKILSQIGLIFFMFIVGMEIDTKILKNKAHQAVVISHASIVIPFALGIVLAYFIYQGYAPHGISFLAFSLFMGIAMSITAFPVLARIVQERGLHKTKLGTLVITCAAADDITAWCILAMVIAIVKAGTFVSSLYTMALAITYVILMIKLLRPFLKRIGDLNEGKNVLSKGIVAIFLLALLISSYATEVIGIHALFGAFMLGAIMPENIRFRSIFVEKIEDFSVVLLLPLYFVFTGLRTQIGLLDNWDAWKLAALVITVAVTGKFVGSALAARFVGQSWKDSLMIGALMNTRGLMELVVLNIGYDLGVLTPEVFAIMVIMALVTTFMTGPLLDLINYIFRSKTEEQHEETKAISKFKVLLSFGTPESARALYRLANSLTRKLNGNASLTAMHLASTNDTHHYNIEEYEQQSFVPVLEEAELMQQAVSTEFKVSNDIDTDITDTANKGDYDLLLIGLGESIYEGTFLGKILGFTNKFINPEKLINTVTGKEKLFENQIFDERTLMILSNTQIATGILIDKGIEKFDRVFIPVFNSGDAFLIDYAQKLIYNAEAQVVVLDAGGQIKNNPVLKENIRAIEQNVPNHIDLQSQRSIDKNFLKSQDLMLISLDSWKKMVETKSVWLSHIPSTLIVSPGNGN